MNSLRERPLPTVQITYSRPEVEGTKLYWVICPEEEGITAEIQVDHYGGRMELSRELGNDWPLAMRELIRMLEAVYERGKQQAKADLRQGFKDLLGL